MLVELKRAKEACCTAWGSSYINVLPISDWNPYQRIRLDRSMGREWAKCNRTCHEWKSLQESYACSQDCSAIIVAGADASSAKILPEIVSRSLPRKSDLACSPEKPGALITLLKSPRVKKFRGKCQFQVLVEVHGIVSILLMFTCAQRKRKWDLYLHIFHQMLQYFVRYNHLQYARWGSVYISEMNQLPKEVLKEFKYGKFVVKWNENKFNQVSPDHSLGWLNGIGKRGGGIVGITKTSSALSRWALSYNLRSQIPENTHTMRFRLHQEVNFSHNESALGRKDRDNNAECLVLTILKQFKVFSLSSLSL